MAGAKQTPRSASSKAARSSSTSASSRKGRTSTAAKSSRASSSFEGLRSSKKATPAKKRKTGSSRNALGNAHPSNRSVPADAEAFTRFTGIRSMLNPLWCYHGFRIAVIILTCFGVVMVFSSSAVTMISAGVSPWKQALSQGMYCVLGLVLGFVAMKLPVGFYQRFSGLFLIIAIILQLLTLTPLGVEVNGNTGWINIAGVFTMQPAEVMKLALCVWLPQAMSIAQQRAAKQGDKAFLFPTLMFGACLGAVLLGKDLGTAMIVVFIGATAFIIGGFPWKWMLAIIGALGALILAVVITSPNRLNRIFAAYGDCSGDDALSVCYQSVHAKYAMASGGLWGVGIGNSREKWNYLPEAHNDFIFAIIGEEMGFIGAAMVILLFVVLGWCLLCVAVKTKDRYVSMVLVCVTVWLVGQGLVNIMVVVGLLPVMGVPMPFVSAGGSSLIMCLAAAGVAISMMRSHPHVQADVSALRS